MKVKTKNSLVYPFEQFVFHGHSRSNAYKLLPTTLRYDKDGMLQILNFHDVLVSVRDKYGFKDEYSDERCLDLAKKMKPIVDDKIQYANWSLRSDIRSKLARDLIVLLVNNGYPPDGQPEAIDKVIAQAENFKKYN